MISYFNNAQFIPLDKAETKFKRLVAQATTIETLSLKIKPLLPIKADWTVTDIHQHCLTLATTNTTAASQLRFMQKQCLDLLHQHKDFKHITKLRVVLYTPISPKLKPLGRPRVLSTQTKQHLANSAILFSDPETAACLKRLSDMA